ncbi:nucleotidyltransferase [Ideonella sp. BN130291]|uniref:nucleotidyltransferase n=1 Tax=Ideonella sp. BN130291 TaxID=3112940 RepID=UPI002E273D45|nr:nucleotidyltransferase [Ideonella sp. BN130291]
MSAVPDTLSSLVEVDPDTSAFYRHVLQALSGAGVPFLVGGAFALACFTEVKRHTKDLDLFIRREDYERIEQLMAEAGYRAELTYPHWLAKVHHGDAFVDLIFSSGNGIAPVDDGWFVHASDAEVLGVQVKVSPAEESLWSKAFIMERERYDGADVAHLLRDRAHEMDWPRLLQRFGPHWRVLLSHLVLFGYIYPGERAMVPGWVMDHLLQRLGDETHAPPPPTQLCAGTLLSREQYLLDVEEQGYKDGRVQPHGRMTPQDVAQWTEAIPSRQDAEPDKH